MKRSFLPPATAPKVVANSFSDLGRPEEVARVARVLCSLLASWVTGQNIAVDGGQML
jgi:NAD(P)-dependent dehydrogenase (short-subunit alcohol dehydrogenase family)